jgi:hypothetical protein
MRAIRCHTTSGGIHRWDREESCMYIGIGTVVVIILIILVLRAMGVF